MDIDLKTAVSNIKSEEEAKLFINILNNKLNSGEIGINEYINYVSMIKTQGKSRDMKIIFIISFIFVILVSLALALMIKRKRGMLNVGYEVSNNPKQSV